MNSFKNSHRCENVKSFVCVHFLQDILMALSQEAAPAKVSERKVSEDLFKAHDFDITIDLDVPLGELIVGKDCQNATLVID